MKRVTTVEFIRNFGTHSDSALSAPIVLTKNGRDRLVLISVEQYDELKNDKSQTAQERRTPMRPKTQG